MAKITALRKEGGRGKRVKVFLDGKSAFSLEAEVAAKEHLQVGEELSTAQIEALGRSDGFQRCFNAAVHYLGYRPRSEAEMRERLYRRGFRDESVEAVITKLKEKGLLDDVSFAQFWKDNREMFSPRSQRLTKLELRRKGIANNIIEQITGAVNDEDSAYRAASGKAGRLLLSDYQSFRRRLGGYLRRRGFDYEVINHTVERMWRERGGRAKDSILS
jgi:regulatory protein